MENGDDRTIYQHPLGYLVALEGIALLRAFAGEYDREFTRTRLAETRELLARTDALGDGVVAAPVPADVGYRQWAPSYDRPGNQLIDIEQPIVQGILASLPVGVALDAACGTGRHAVYLAGLGHRVIGIDGSAEMLASAQAKLPDAEFHVGDLHRIPVPDAQVDLVVCALALTHVPSLAPVFAEFVRVLRPHGHLVISDSRGLIDGVGLPMPTADAQGRPAYMPVWQRHVSDYLSAALPLGLAVRRCEEPRRASPVVAPETGTFVAVASPAERGPEELPSIWDLHQYAAAAANAAYRDSPVAIIWHFQRG